jgi:hypothetical protein
LLPSGALALEADGNETGVAKEEAQLITNPTPQQIEIIQALTTNASNGSKAFFELVNGDNLKALLHNLLQQ